MANRRFNRQQRKMIMIITFAVMILLITAVIVLSVNLADIYKKYQADEEYIAVQASKVYEYYNEKDVILMDDPTYGEIWLAALDDVPLSSYKQENLRIQGDYRYYTENGEKTSHLGIDVSYFQQDINWQLVKESGIEYVMIRVGYRGYETGSLNKDTRFDEYIKGATEAGLHVGVYFFSQAVTVEEALEEADFVLEAIAPYELSYPVVYDWEIIGGETARTEGMPAQMLTDCTAAFCNKIAKAGYIPMVYASKRQALLKTDMSALAGFDFWLAEYREEPTYPYEFQMWQYSPEARIPGIEGDTDINICFVDYSTIRKPTAEGTE